MKSLFVVFTLLSFTFVLSQPARSYKNDSYTYIKSNLEFLAADELEGREVTSRGEKLASLFISKELEKYGVLPFGENGTYIQEVPFAITSYSKGSHISLIKNENEIITYNNGNNAVFSSRILPSNKYNNRKLDIVFAGYGIVSLKDNYDSYKNLDVSGKAVIILNGTPKRNGKELLSGPDIRKFRRSYTDKVELAMAKGAEAVLIIADEILLKYWEYVSYLATSKSYKLEDEVDSTNYSDNIPVVIFNDTAAADLLKNEKFTINEILKTDISPFELQSKIILDYEVIHEKKNGRNIIGLIKGNNHNYTGQYLTIGAHYDHVGIINGKIHNGADDNGSGTAAVLEVARRLAMKKENERPVVVIFHTGEEKGLKGSKFLTNNSTFVDSAILHINIDMIGRKSEDSIYTIGAKKLSSELGSLLEDVNEETVKVVMDKKFDDPDDPQRLYYRSDHIHYANKGIPIVFFYDYMKKDYHRPTDTMEKINFDKIVKMSELIYELMIRVSNLDHTLTIDRIDTN